MSKRTYGRVIGTLVAVPALVLTLAACGSSGGGSKSTGAAASGGSSSSGGGGGGSKATVTLGTKDFSEQFLLGELYAQALTAAGFKISLKKNIGSSEIIDKSLTSGKIDGYPEYTGVIYSNATLANLGDHPASAKVTYEGAKKWEAGRGYTMLEPTPFQDADGLAVSKSFAAKNGLKTISDMSKLKSFTYAGPPENATRYQGVVGLKQAYKLNNFTFKPLATGSQYTALDGGSVDAIAIFTTDGQLASGKYTVLSDTKGIFGFQQVAPIVKQSVLDAQGPEFADTLNAVSKLLTSDAIIAMNKAVQIDQQEPGAVAKTFLQANHMVP
jgi:osmoprotectant transport system substrate-binding protein